MKKKIISTTMILLSFIIAGCNKNTLKEDYNNYQTSSYLSKEIVDNMQDGAMIVELNKQYTPEYMLEISDSVAIVSIISVDKADTNIMSFCGGTYGTLVVNNVLYGNLNQGDKISYLKSGGVMTLEEFEKNDIPEAIEKRQELRDTAGVDVSKEYVNFHYEDDPLIEDGKVYLAYLKYMDKFDMYEIIGLGDGFRELNIPKNNYVTDQTLSIADYKILNNHTKQYESLNNYVQQNIKIEIK